MRRSSKLLALVITIVMTASVLALAANAILGETAQNYDDYGYYAYFDFENYGNATDHHSYMKSATVKNKDGKLCDPFDFLTGLGDIVGDGKVVEEDGNTYYSFVQHDTNSYATMAVFAMQTNDSNNAIIGDAAEISFRFRMQADQSEDEGEKLPLLNLRRGSSAGRTNYLLTDIYGNIYAVVNGKTVKVYENSGDGKFMDISFRWYDVTNTYSLYVNGEAVVEAIPLSIDYRGGKYVSQTFNDDFSVESRKVVGTGVENYRAIELLRRETTSGNFSFDIDDIKLSRIETAQKGAVYYENSFEGDVDGVSALATNGGSYVFVSPTTNSVNNLYIGEENGNRYLDVKSGSCFGLKDNPYQVFTSNSYVVEFSVKAKTTHTSGYKSLLGFIDNKNVNWIGALKVGADGSLYFEENEATRIGNYKLDGEEWLDFAVVVTKDETNSGRFGSFASSKTRSSLNCVYNFSYYINGEFVGTSKSAELLEWKLWTESGTEYSRVSSNFNMTRTHTEGALDLAGLTVVADGVNGNASTSNHIIYKNSDGSVYYDVEYASDKTTQLRYSTMTIGDAVGEDSFRFFIGGTFEGAIDNIRIYDGTAPAWYYEKVNSDSQGNIIAVDFANMTFASEGVSAKTNGSGSNVLGSFISAGVTSQSIKRGVDADNEGYATITFNPGNWFDFYIPVPESVNGVIDVEYSFETTVKNFNIVSGSDTIANRVGFFSNRFENDAGYKAMEYLMSVDASFNLWGGNCGLSSTRIALYNKNGTRVKIDNNNWNTLRADIRFYSDRLSTNAEISYYLNGELLYLSDGSPAYRIVKPEITTAVALEKFGNQNYRVRYTQLAGANSSTGDPGDTVTFDVKAVSVSKNGVEKPVYETVAKSFNDKVKTIEFTLDGLAESANYGNTPVVILEKTDSAGEYRSFNLLLADLKSRELSVNIGDETYKLCDVNGNTYKISGAGTPVAVVYDDVNGAIRYFVNKKIAYINLDGTPVLAVDMDIENDFYSLEKVASESIKLFVGFKNDENEYASADSYKLNAYTVNSEDTVKLIGFQENSITDGMRLIAGVDTLYYTNVGFEIETFVGGISKGVVTVSGTSVYDSVVANDKTLTAEANGYNYLTAAIITDVIKNISENSFIVVRAYSEIEGIRHYDESAMMAITSNGYYFVTEETVYENNFNGINSLPAEWVAGSKNSAASTISLKNGEICLDGYSSSLVDYYLNRNLGSNYIVQADFRVTANANSTRWMGLTLRLKDVSNYMLVGFRVNGDWFIETHSGTSYQKLATGSTGKPFALGQTYKVSAMCYGDNIALFLDGVFVTEVTVPAVHTSGAAGVSLGGVTLNLDNFIVKSITDRYDGNLLYSENFDGLTAVPTGWSRLAKASTNDSSLVMEAKDNTLYVKDWSGSRTVICYDKELSGNYVFEADLYADELRDATRYMGIVFGAHDDGSMIAVNMRMSDGRIQFEALNPVDGSWTKMTPDTKRSSAPAVKTTYKFRIECVDGYASFFIDGVKYARFEIPEKFLSGKVGVIISQDAVKIDNVRMLEVKEYTVSEEVPETRYELIETPVFAENFNGLTSVPNGWNKMTTATSTPANLTVGVENDSLLISDSKSAIVAVSYDRIFSGNYTVEADITLVNRANADRYMGVLIGVQEDDAFAGIQMRLSDGRFELTKWDSVSGWANIGETVYLKDKMPLELNTSYHFKLVCVDGYATAYVNGMNCGSFAIPEKHLSGKIGFVTSQATIKVDNVRVTELVKYELEAVYEENFDKLYEVPAEWINSSDTALVTEIVDGALNLKNEEGRSIVGIDYVVDGNFIYEADLTMTYKYSSDSWWMGPVLGIQTDGTYVLYDANIATGKWSVTPWNGKSWDPTLAAAVNASEYLKGYGANITQKFKLVCINGVGIISVNGVECCRFDIPEKFRSGKLGIGFRNSTVVVDNVAIYKLNESTENNVVYEESFNGGASATAEWSKNAKGSQSNSALEISVDNGKMVLKDTVSMRTVVAVDREINGENFIFEAELTMTEKYNSPSAGSWWMGPAFGIKDNGNFVMMDTNTADGKWYVEHWNSSTSKWDAEFARAASSAAYISTFRMNVPQHFKLVVIDGVGTISVNGTKICTFNISEDYLKGKVGVGFKSSTVLVDNVRLEIIPDAPGLNNSANTLTNQTLSLGENHVMHNKTLSFKFNVSDFADSGVITVGHGDNIPDGSWIEITNKTVTAYSYLNGKTQTYSAEHGLDISGNVEVIVESYYDTARARIKLANNTAFSTETFAWSGRDGEIFAKSTGVTLENAKLNWNSTEFENNVWIIGDSGLDINSDTSWAYYLKKGGLTLIGSRDETSATAVAEFRNALKQGVPEYAVWCIGMNDADSDSAVNSAWKSALDEFLALCKDKGVTPILATIPNTPSKNHTFKNSVVTSSGYRYIDFAKAVGASAKGSSWASGMLSSDKSTPTSSGAAAMYKEVLMDFTEIKENMGGTRIRVATFNTGNFTGRGLKRTTEEARVAYYELMESVNADLWGLQEDSQYFDVADDKATEGTRPYDAVYKYILPNHDGFFTGTYHGKSFLTRFELYDVEQIYYPAPATSYQSSVYHYGHRWFLTGKIMVDGKEITVISLHLDWNCKERRATQLQTLVEFAKKQEYCIIMGDFNPEDYINSVEISKALFYEEELALFAEIGMSYANAGKFGTFDTLLADDASLCGPWDNILVTSNIKLISAERVALDWMNDHAIVVAEMEIN